eukprot:79988-Pelagomonas_calceolata.AAC.2
MGITLGKHLYSRSGIIHVFLRYGQIKISLHGQSTQRASRRVSVKKEQSNFEAQARCRFRPKLN